MMIYPEYVAEEQRWVLRTDDGSDRLPEGFGDVKLCDIEPLEEMDAEVAPMCRWIHKPTGDLYCFITNPGTGMSLFVKMIELGLSVIAHHNMAQMRRAVTA